MRILHRRIAQWIPTERIVIVAVAVAQCFLQDPPLVQVSLLVAPEAPHISGREPLAAFGTVGVVNHGVGREHGRDVDNQTVSTDTRRVVRAAFRDLGGKGIEGVRSVAQDTVFGGRWKLGSLSLELADVANEDRQEFLLHYCCHV